MTFKDLKKRLNAETAQQQSSLFERLLNKPFWISDQQQHKHEDITTNGDCCFNHIIGLPSKDMVDKPLYDYEKTIYEYLTILVILWHYYIHVCMMTKSSKAVIYY
jgi:hypothetical protein